MTKRFTHYDVEPLTPKNILNFGPMVACFNWNGIYYQDENDVYRCRPEPPHDDKGHCVVITGYSNSGGYWIFKNSWGATWGPDFNGYGKLGYDECNLDTTTAYILGEMY